MVKTNNSGFSPVQIVLLISFYIIIGLIAFGSWQIISNKNQSKETFANPVDAEVKADDKPVAISAPATTAAPAKYPDNLYWDDPKMLSQLNDIDILHKKNIFNFSFRVVGYYLNHNNTYPLNATEASTIQDRDDPTIDPVTNTPYKIVDYTPSTGEMQYKISTTCDDYNRDFYPLSKPSNNIFALKVKLSEGSYICKSSIK